MAGRHIGEVNLQLLEKGHTAREMAEFYLRQVLLNDGKAVSEAAIGGMDLAELAKVYYHQTAITDSSPIGPRVA